MKIGFLGVLALIFITLKLIGEITWSWVWVLSPIWLPFALFILILIFYAPIQYLIWLGDKRRRK
jgi:hypothetical protein